MKGVMHSNQIYSTFPDHSEVKPVAGILNITAQSVDTVLKDTKGRDTSSKAAPCFSTVFPSKLILKSKAATFDIVT